jgi:hypothetical protein
MRARLRPRAPLAASLAAGEPVEVDYQSSFVDGIGAPVVFTEMFDLVRHLVEGSIVTTLNGVASAIRVLLERQHVVAEGAGAAPVAAAPTGEAGTGKSPALSREETSTPRSSWPSPRAARLRLGVASTQSLRTEVAGSTPVAPTPYTVCDRSRVPSDAPRAPTAACRIP